MEKKNLFGMCYLLEERKNFRAEEEAEKSRRQDDSAVDALHLPHEG